MIHKENVLFGLEINYKASIRLLRLEKLGDSLFLYKISKYTYISETVNQNMLKLLIYYSDMFLASQYTKYTKKFEASKFGISYFLIKFIFSHLIN